MKKIILFFALFFFGVNLAFSHPLDISVSTANIKGKSINLTTYFHSFEIEYLLKNNGIISDGVNYYFENDDIIKNYVRDNSSFLNDGKNCEIKNISLEKDETYKILTDGLGVNYTFSCEDKIEKFNLNFNYFTEFKLQTNRITIYDLNNGIKNIKPIVYKVLTSKITNLYIDLNNLNVKRIDSDRDGLSDEEEKIYFTDINKVDTDGDFYTDKEEIDFGWDPLNAELGPNQEYRIESDLDLSYYEQNNVDKIEGEVGEKNLSDYGSGNDFLKKVMKYMNDYFEKSDGSIFTIFTLVFFLGILHAIGPGHSKGLLIAYTLEKDNGYKKGILFSLVFTITHMVDILILFFITKVIITFVDPNKYIYNVQFISAIILLFISMYLIYKAFNKNNNNSKSEKTGLGVAFLAGLAPCSFAWSIYLLLIALGKSSWIFPLILALGLGIFTTLFFIVILTVFFKNKLYEKVQIIGKYSKIFSAIIIFIIAVVMIMSLL